MIPLLPELFWKVGEGIIQYEIAKKKKKKICLQNLSNISFFGILPTNFCTTIADSKPNVDMSFIVCFNSSVSSLFFSNSNVREIFRNF